MPVPTETGDVGISSYHNTTWRGSYTAQFTIEVALAIGAGSGTVSVTADGQAQTQSFAGIRFASDAEIAQYLERVTQTAVDANGNVVPITRALTFVDENQALVNIVPILSEGELYLHPMGPLLKETSADEPEAGALTCGGLAGELCPKGFRCKTPPGQLDAVGVCVRASTPQPQPAPPPPTGGGNISCGGFAGNTCPSGMMCRPRPGEPFAPGRCVPRPAGGSTGGGSSGSGSSSGGTAGPTRCGGFAGIQCTPPLVCRMRQPPELDGQGVCVRP